jgi:hypothetical protein
MDSLKAVTIFNKENNLHRLLALPRISPKVVFFSVKY